MHSAREGRQRLPTQGALIRTQLGELWLIRFRSAWALCIQGVARLAVELRIGFAHCLPSWKFNGWAAHRAFIVVAHAFPATRKGRSARVGVAAQPCLHSVVQWLPTASCRKRRRAARALRDTRVVWRAKKLAAP